MATTQFMKQNHGFPFKDAEVFRLLFRLNEVFKNISIRVLNKE